LLTWYVSSLAVGGSFTFSTVMVTDAVARSPSTSSTVYVNVSSPKKSGDGVYST
jgi:hypothetical protein